VRTQVRSIGDDVCEVETASKVTDQLLGARKNVERCTAQYYAPIGRYVF
jgi:hypothetical protein